MIVRSLLLVAVLVAAAPGAGRAQVGIEVRGGGAIGNHAPAAAGLETIPGPSVTASLFLAPAHWIALYGSYSRSSFGCEEGFCTDRDVLITTGSVIGGARLYLSPGIWLQGGIVNLTTVVSANDAEDRASPELGLEGGFGFRVRLAGPVALVPAFLYRAGIEPAGRTTVVAGELGLQVRLR
ncbi:MAG TPA: hypothetical protein VMN39_01275 [Longimicrobiaceae bacterium]|nr:hypothetical protein [Longimicrobiaceae bacterium]